jgi:hypothetical protein
MEIDMTRIGIALTAATLLTAGPALACGHAYNSSRSYQVVHHAKATYTAKDLSYSRNTNAAVVAPSHSSSAPADEALVPKIQASAAAGCKEYSPTVGHTISVPCAK